MKLIDYSLIGETTTFIGTTVSASDKYSGVEPEVEWIQLGRYYDKSTLDGRYLLTTRELYCGKEFRLIGKLI